MGLDDIGTIHLRIEEILKEKGISKNKLCRDMEIPRPNLNRYCRDEFMRLDANLLCKLMTYLDVTPAELIEHRR